MQPPYKVDPEDFQQWKEHPLTQWVLGSLKEAAEGFQRQREQSLFSLSQASPEMWASLQPNAAYAKGFVEATEKIVGITLNELLEPDEAETE